MEGAKERFGGGALQECASLGVDRRAEEIVGGGVTNVEVDCGIERCKLDEIILPERSFFYRRRRGKRLAA